MIQIISNLTGEVLVFNEMNLEVYALLEKLGADTTANLFTVDHHYWVKFQAMHQAYITELSEEITYDNALEQNEILESLQEEIEVNDFEQTDSPTFDGEQDVQETIALNTIKEDI